MLSWEWRGCLLPGPLDSVSDFPHLLYALGGRDLWTPSRVFFALLPIGFGQRSFPLSLARKSTGKGSEGRRRVRVGYISSTSSFQAWLSPLPRAQVQPTQKSYSLGVGNGSSPCPSDLSGDHRLLLPALGYHSVTGSIFLNSVCISMDSSFIKFPSKHLLWVCPLFPSGTWLTDWMPVMNEKNGSFGCKTQG